VTRVDRLVVELRRAVEGDAWHGPALLEVLDAIPSEMAWRRPLSATHTIVELALHCTAWTEEVRRRVGGAEPAEPQRGDWPAAPECREASWDDVRDALRAAHAALLGAVAALDAARLDDPVGATRDAAAGTGVTVEQMLLGLAQHHAYHGGQASMLRRALMATA
jgi:uncharacterized damage-inducible protein DinB